MPTQTRTPLFLAEQFVPTEFDSAADKAEFANLLADFILSGFPEKKFTKRLYDWLYHHFGMIAHYDRGGFWAEYFTSTEDKCRFVGDLQRHPCYGDPACTFSDMEKAFQKWMRKNEAGIVAAIEGSVPAEEEIPWISLAAVRRRLAVGVTCVGEYLLPDNRVKSRVHRRRVTKQTAYEMVCRLLDGPKSGSDTHLKWANVKAYEVDDAIVFRGETGKDFLKITFPPKEIADGEPGGD